MDHSFFRIPISMDARNAIAVDGTSSHATPSEHVQLDRLGVDNKKRRSVDCSGHSSFMGEQLDLRSEFHSRNQTMTMYSDALVATLMGSRSDLQENLDNTTISAASSYLSEGFRSYHPSNCSNSLNSSFVCATGHECDEMFGNIFGKGDHQYIPPRASFQPCSDSRNVEASGWISGYRNASIDDHYDSRRFTNELSLSLATSQHSIIDNASIPDQCSEILDKETRLSSEQTSSDTGELGLKTILHGHGQIFQALAGSRFLEVIQEILTQIASYSLKSLDQPSYSAWGTKTAPNSLFFSGNHLGVGPLPGSNEPPNADGGIHIEMDFALQRRALEAKKRQLLTLLEVVDERYNQCLDDIHTVVSAFHAATELDPQLHTRFALQATTSLYRGLKERISKQILAIRAHSESSSSRELLAYSETSYLQNQWSLHQLKRKDHQLWRPQRGLPERSVLVLRAWMFENFLHP